MSLDIRTLYLYVSARESPRISTGEKELRRLLVDIKDPTEGVGFPGRPDRTTSKVLCPGPPCRPLCGVGLSRRSRAGGEIIGKQRWTTGDLVP